MTFSGSSSSGGIWMSGGAVKQTFVRLAADGNAEPVSPPFNKPSRVEQQLAAEFFRVASHDTRSSASPVPDECPVLEEHRDVLA